MSRVLIQHYLNDLATLRQVSGSHRESVVREAFKDLLKGWARSHELVFVPELIERQGDRVVLTPGGRLLANEVAVRLG